MRSQKASRFQLFLSGHPGMANRLMGFLGPKRLARIGQRVASQAAYRAYEKVPFYQRLYEKAGVTDDQMRHLPASDFQRLPITKKKMTENVPDADLITKDAPDARSLALIGLSSGTRSKPTHWPTGWKELSLTGAAFRPIFRYLGTPQGAQTAVVMAMAVEGGDASGNMPYRLFYSLKERTGWNMELIATGEQSEVLHDWLCWLADNGFTSLMFASFPGTVERFLDYEQSLPAEQRVNWDAFTRKHIALGGQLVDRSLRQRYYKEMRLDPNSLSSELILYIASDTAQLIARSTPFTLWLERYIEHHPELADALGMTLETQDKPILELMPPMAMYCENDPEEGLLLTTWKIRPLIRYAIGDRLWLPQSENILPILKKATPTWRRDFARAGGHRYDVTRSTRIAVVLGRADAIVIVNGANISPEMVAEALKLAGLADQIHHFKHANNPAQPNVYHVLLELHEAADDATRAQLECDWQAPLLAAMLQVPAATDLVAAHRTNPIELKLHVRSRGTGEFADAQNRKRTYTLSTEQLRNLDT